MFVLVRMQLRNHADAQPVKRYKGYTILDLGWCECARFYCARGTAQLHTLEGTSAAILPCLSLGGYNRFVVSDEVAQALE